MKKRLGLPHFLKRMFYFNVGEVTQLIVGYNITSQPWTTLVD